MGVADADKRPVGRVSHGAVALVGHIPGHAGGQHIPFAAVLGYGDTLAAERRVEIFILPADFFLCRQKVGGQLQRDNAAVVGVHIQIGVTAAYGNVKITDFIAEGAVVVLLDLIRPCKGVRLQNCKAGCAAAVLDPADVFAGGRALDDMRAVGVAGGVQGRVLIGEIRQDNQAHILPVVQIGRAIGADAPRPDRHLPSVWSLFSPYQ